MTRVVVNIGRLVVHGTDRFASEAFIEGLREEISRRIAQGASAADIARQVQGNALAAHHGRVAVPRKAGPRATPERTVAAEVAGRLLT